MILTRMYLAVAKQVTEGSSCQQLTDALARFHAQVSSRCTMGRGSMLIQKRLALYYGEFAAIMQRQKAGSLFKEYDESRYRHELQP